MTRKTPWIIFVLVCLTASLGMASTMFGIGPSCGSCQGAVYTLSEDLLSTGTTQDVYEVQFQVDTSTYTGGAVYINSVALKVESSIIAATILNAPPPAATWVVGLGGLNASSGCSGSGSGFFCAESAAGASLVNPINTWNFQVTVAHNSNVFDFIPSGKVLFVNGDGAKVGNIFSENFLGDPSGGGGGGNTPEPATATLALLGGGIVVGLRRKNKKAATS